MGLGDPHLGSHTCVASSLPLSHLLNPQSSLFCLRLGSFLKDNYKLKAFLSEVLLLLCIRSTPLLTHSVPIKLDENSIYRALRIHWTLSLTLLFFHNKPACLFRRETEAQRVKLAETGTDLVQMEVRMQPGLTVFLKSPYSVLCPTFHIIIIAFSLLTVWSRIRLKPLLFSVP